MNISDRLDQEADHIVAAYSQHCLPRAVDRQADDWLLVRSGLATLAERIKDDAAAEIERLRDLIRRAESICGPGLAESPLEESVELLHEMRQIRDEDAAEAEAIWQTIPAADLPQADMASIADPIRTSADEAAKEGDANE